MTKPGESVEGITVPPGDPEALGDGATQLRAVAAQLHESAARLAAAPSLLSSWAGPGSSQFALLSGDQAAAARSSAVAVSMTALSVQNATDVLADSQRDARRAIGQAEEARGEIDRAKAQIKAAEEDQKAARRRMDDATAVRVAALHAPLLGATGVGDAAAALAERDYRAAEADLHEAEGREHRARGRLDEAEADMRRAREQGRIAAQDAETSGASLQMALATLPARAPAMAGAPAAGRIADRAGIPRPQVREVPLSEREPPESWPGPLKSLFKLGRGEATAISGLFNLGRSAVEHPTEVPGALYGVGERAVNDPLGTGKALVGYDELASGRYEDWLGQLGVGFLTGGAAARGARLRRVVGPPKPHRLGPMQPRWSGAFAGRRVDFSKPDLGARAGTAPKVPADRARLARDFPRGVRFTRAGHPVFTPYATRRVHVEGLNGEMRHDNRLANARAGIEGWDPPDGYTWHHAEDGTTMELVPRELHRNVYHTGGRAAMPGQLSEVIPGGAFTRGERGAGGLGVLGGGPAAGEAEGGR